MKYIIPPVFRFMIFLNLGILYYLMLCLLFIGVFAWNLDYRKTLNWCKDTPFMEDDSWFEENKYRYNTPLDYLLKRNSYGV